MIPLAIIIIASSVLIKEKKYHTQLGCHSERSQHLNSDQSMLPTHSAHLWIFIEREVIPPNKNGRVHREKPSEETNNRNA